MRAEKSGGGERLRIRACRGPEEYPSLVAIWRSAVDATHGVLAAEDRAEIEAHLIPEYFPHVDLVIAERGGSPVGFAGVAASKLEMLFVDAPARGSGVGSALVAHVVEVSGVDAVDVNEHNDEATTFYRRRGFVITGRSPHDDQGRPYPILHLSREGYSQSACVSGAL